MPTGGKTMKTISEIHAARNALIDILDFCREIMADEILFEQDTLDEIFNFNSERQLSAVIKLLTELNPES